MKSITVSAPGKLHLLGEHSVVYGKPAIIAAVNKRSIVTLIPQQSKTVSLRKNGVVFQEVSEVQIQERTRDTQNMWEQFVRTNDNTPLRKITKEPSDYILLCIGEALHAFGTQMPSGFSLSIACDIPIGSGMGSSAAVAVSVVGALALFLGKPMKKKRINEIAFKIEQKKHGFSSGGDNTASCYGGCIWYQKSKTDEKIIEPLILTVPKALNDKFLIIQTGIPDETTGDMVSLVRKKYMENTSYIQAILDDQEKLVMQLPDVIEKNDEEKFLFIIRQGEKNLESIGVVSEITQKMIRAIENCGGGAKICGAGGVQHASGIVLAYHRDIKRLTQFLHSHEIAFSSIQLGAEGIR